MPEEINYNLRQKVWIGILIGTCVFWSVVFYLITRFIS